MEEIKNTNTVNWSSNKKYIIALLSWTTGFLNIFHTPKLLNKCSFLDYIITYIFLMVIMGIPLTFMELSISQYSNKATIKSWNICPVFRGIGYSKIMLLLIFQMYYNSINSYVLFYTFSAFYKSIKWKRCNKSWANSTCYGFEEEKFLESNTTKQSSIEQFWFNNVININENSTKFGWFNLELIGVYCLIIFIVFLVNNKGTNSLEKCLPFTLIISSIEIFIMLIATTVTTGSLNGLKYLSELHIHISALVPWNKKSVILDVFQEILYSTGIGLGGLSSLGSQSFFRKPVHAYAILLNLFNIGISIIGLIITFNLYGIINHYKNIKIDHLIEEKYKFSNNIFTIIPGGMIYLPGSDQIWVFCFYSSIFLKGISSSILMASTVLHEIYEFKPYLVKHSVICTFVYSVFLGLSGLVLYSNIGIIIGTFINELISSTLLPIINCTQIIAIIYIYGLINYMDDIHFMLGFRPTVYWQLNLVLTSFMLPILTIFSIIEFFENSALYYKFKFITTIQQCLLLTILFWIPFMVMVRMIRKKNWRDVLNSSKDWGPYNNFLKKNRKIFIHENLTFEFIYEKNLVENKLTKYDNNI